MRRRLLTACGLAAAGLGAAGIFLPLLPATPFLLLALLCFARSSERLHRRLLNHRLCGPHLRYYLERRAVPLSVKVSSLALLWLSLGVSAAIVDKPWVDLLLGAVGIGVSLHLLFLRTIPREPQPALEKAPTAPLAAEEAAGPD